MRRNNPLIQAKIYQARQKKASEIRASANAGFVRGAKAGARAAVQLLKEGVPLDDQFEALVLKRAREKPSSPTQESADQ